jgi:RNA polymerase sigma-70 factor (ECF subfamily)
MKSRSLDIEHLSTLIERVARGDQKAFSDLHALTRNKLRKTALTVCPSRTDVEDLLQDAYLKIWRNASSFDPERSSPISWMCAITRNTAIDAVRLRKLPIADLDEALSVAAPTEDPADEFDLAMVRDIAAEAIGRLSEQRRDLLSLAYLQGESRAALSKRFGVPVGTIKTWLRRTLQSVSRDCLPYADPDAATNAAA